MFQINLKCSCKSVDIEQVFSSSYHHQSNGQVEAYIKFIKCTLKKCFDTKGYPHIALLQIQMTQLVISSLTTILFNHLIRGKMQIISRPLISVNNDKEHYEGLVNRQTKDDKNQGTPRNYVTILTWLAVVVLHEDEGLWTNGTIEGKGSHNHLERSYNICITKTS